MFPTNICLEKYQKKKVTVFALEIRWAIFMPVLTLITRVISSVHGTFCGNWNQRFLK